MTSAGGAFDKAAQAIENHRKRTTQRHHLKQTSLAVEESLGPFPVIDCAEKLVLQSGPFGSIFLKSELGGSLGEGQSYLGVGCLNVPSAHALLLPRF